MLQETLGTFLRELRKGTDREHLPPPPPDTRRRRLKGMTRQEVALAAVLSPSYIEKIERDVQMPSPSALDGILTACGASTAERRHAEWLSGVETVTTEMAEHIAISDEEKRYLDCLTPHMAGYVDFAWNVLYANPEYSRVFRGIEHYGNVLFWLLECENARTIMVNWEYETQLTVTWARSLSARLAYRDSYAQIVADLSANPDFQRMWAAEEPTIGRPTAIQRIKDPDTGIEFGLHVQLWNPPQLDTGLQMYLGVRV